MKTRKFIWTFLSVAAVLLLVSCGSDDANEVTPTPSTEPSATVKSIPYTVTVNQGGTTRATVDDDLKTLRFASGDKLYVEGTNISGVLELTAGTGSASGTFSGSLFYSGAEPSSSLALSATLVSAEALSCGFFTISDGKVTGFTYPNNAVCVKNGESSAVNEAVKKYSVLRGSSTFGAKTFSLAQQTAFLNFTLTMHDGSTTGKNMEVTFANSGSTVYTGNATVENQGKTVEQVKFVVPVASGTTLSSATIKLADYDAQTINSSASLSGKVYNVNKTFKIPEPAGVTGVQLWSGGPYWATMNVGATSVTDYGLYFTWGETTGYSSRVATDHNFSWENYTYCDGSSNTLTKYCNNSSFGKDGFTDALTVLESSDDAASANWGGSWRMPTKAEFDALLSNTTREWQTNYQGSGHAGFLFTGKTVGYTDKSIFLPAAGGRGGSSIDDQGKYGNFLSSSLDTSEPSRGHRLFFNSGSASTTIGLRYGGRSVRPVHD